MSSPLLFAVVREDARIESQLIEQTGARSALVVASGGCTALSLSARHPDLRVVAFDRNPAQLEHMRRKRAALERGDFTALNLGDARATGLNQRGAFEALFRLLRQGFCDLVAGAEALEEFFDAGTRSARRLNLLRIWTASPAWAPVFASAFHDELLHAMFGAQATQHAPRGSYPGYFARAFAALMARPDAGKNPFLQHVFLGQYLPHGTPDYLSLPPGPAPELVLGALEDVPDLGRFDLLSLSNVLDWNDDAFAERWGVLLARHVHPGAVVLFRQLNNTRDLARPLGPAFSIDGDATRSLTRADRSGFYDRVIVAVRR